MTNNNKIPTVEIIKKLKKATSVNQVLNEIGMSSKSLRRLFKKEGLKPPSFYLPIFANSFEEEEIKSIKPIMNDEVINYSKVKSKLDLAERDEMKKDALKWQMWKYIVGDKLFSFLQEAVGNYPVPRFDLNIKRDYAAILSIQDFHFGRWSTPLEVKSATNINKQQMDLFNAVHDLMEKVAVFGLPEILYLTIGGDFLNSDNYKLSTTRGTEQDSLPSHVYMMFNGGILLVQLIDMLRQIFPKIELVITPGNHDRDSSLSLYMFVSAWFKEVPEIKSIYSDLKKPSDLQDANLCPRQYRVYGENLLCFIHGDNPSIKKMPMVIANEARNVWGSTKYTMLISGHRHSRISQDLEGVQHLQVPSLAGDDRYHGLHAYHGQRGLTMILVDKNKGYMAELFSPCD